MATDYKQYLRGYDNPIDELRILEIGYFHSPILKEASKRARSVEYHAITREEKDKGILPGNHNVRLRRQVKDIRRVPWNFPTGYFNEFHCHMLDTSIVDRVQGITGSQFVQQVDLTLKNPGTVYLTVQNGYFFGNDFSRFEEDFIKLRKLFEKIGYQTLVQQWGRDYLLDHDKIKSLSEDKEGRVDDNSVVDIVGVDTFTNLAEYVDGLLITKKKIKENRLKKLLS